MKEHTYGHGDKMNKIKRMMKINKDGTLKDKQNKQI